jgi:hypothetical protein
MIDEAARAEIVSLAMQAYKIYEDARRRPSGKVCDICGAGDRNKWYKVKAVVHGYTHRPDESPCLCPNHATGWALSFNSFEGYRRAVPDAPALTDEEINLHFARFLTRHLLKAANDNLQLD